jgi:hypothetical protein
MLLLISVVGVMVVAGSRALSEAGRAITLQAVREEATQVALTGIQEGLLYLGGGAGLNADGEYGVSGATGYSLTPWRRGYTRTSGEGAPCLNQTVAQDAANASAPDRTCPWYDLTIRDRAAYSSATIGAFTLSSTDFPSGAARMIPVQVPGTVQLTVNNSAQMSSPAVTWQLCTTQDVATCGGGTPVNPGGVISFSSPAKQYLRLIFGHTFTTDAPQSVIVGGVYGGAGQITLGKGFRTIDSTGYAGDAVVRLRYVVRGDNTQWQSEVSNYYDSLGQLKP